ncbi:hypothetical protein HDU98_011063 [Podochytrium sp. JEL0797]|nr:hypothetical protein HDU98_011063 [Podochytrium sp. JEL0797]
MKFNLPLAYQTISENHNVTRSGEDIVRRLMEPDQTLRLSSLRGISEIKGHSWFRPLTISWKEIEEGKLRVAFVPGNEMDERLIAKFLENRAQQESLGTTRQYNPALSILARSKTNSLDEDDECVVDEEGALKRDPMLSENEIVALVQKVLANW